MDARRAHAERLIGSIRKECIDHIVVFGEGHLRHVLLSYMSYYNGTRPHLSLNKDAPISRAAETQRSVGAFEKFTDFGSVDQERLLERDAPTRRD